MDTLRSLRIRRAGLIFAAMAAMFAFTFSSPALAAETVAPKEAPAASGKSAEFVGAETCLTCHADHETFKKNLHAKAMAAAKNIEFSRTCETCHGPGSLHAAAGGDKNDAGFATIKNPSKLNGSEASATCLQCHEGGKRMHWQGSTHDMKNVSCVNCHGMHSDKINNGKAPLLRAATGAEACYQCHAEKKSQIRKSGHMPLVEGKMGCTGCHNPHGSSADKLMAKNTVAETCYQCHQDKRGPFLWDHNPARQNCITCHDPHGSHNDKMLVQRAPMLCQRCHVGGRHPATAYGNSAGDLVSNRLAYKGCVNCHFAIHGSNNPSGKWLNR